MSNAPRKPDTSVLPNRTPGQAEGSEEDVDAALEKTDNAKQNVSRDPKVPHSHAPEPGKTPGQAEG